VYFSLWGNGGPNFIRELSQWEVEELQSWSVVGSRSFADVVHKPLSGANLVPLGPSNRVEAYPRPVPSRLVVPLKISFLHRLTEWEKNDFEPAIFAGYDYAQILNCFRLTRKIYY
jgi:hypothetical protein